MHRLITTTDELASFCNLVKEEPHLTIDTEFIREKTYWPRLCLIQVGGSARQVAIDPLAPLMDLSPLFELLHNPGILKVLHAGRQDLEIFWKLTGAVPTPVFDTQIAAQVIGMGESVGYEALISTLLNLRVDKSQRFTDWSLRPLSQKQVDYALGDVIHLRAAYSKMRSMLESRGRTSWILEEMAALQQPSLYTPSPETAWERIRFSGANGRHLANLRVLAAWREHTAIADDIPRVRVLRDETLVDLAVNLPKDEDSLRRIRGFPQHFKREWRPSFWEAIKQADATAKEDWPQRGRPDPLPKGGEEMLELLRLLLKLRAREHDVTPRLVADKDELEAFVRGKRDLHMLSGWRREVFGDKALALIEGKLAVSFDPAKKDIVWSEN
jgi:ribonuclease D